MVQKAARLQSSIANAHRGDCRSLCAGFRLVSPPVTKRPPAFQNDTEPHRDWRHTASGSSQVRGVSTRRQKRPKAPKLHVVPFQLREEDALRYLAQHEQGRWMAPLSSEQGAANSTALVAWRPDCGVRAVFLPFRVVNAVASAKYTGQVGYTRTFSVTGSDGKTTTQSHTDYVWVRGSLDRVSFDGKGGDSNMQIYSDFRYSEGLLDAVKGHVASQAVHFNAAALNIKEEPTLDPFRMTVEGTRAEAMARMEAALTQLAEQELRRTHFGCSHVQRTTISSFNVLEYHVRSMYLPAYVFTTQYGDRRLKRFVGGATGRYRENRRIPRSRVQFWASELGSWEVWQWPTWPK